jgi:hypothetical protein
MSAILYRKWMRDTCTFCWRICFALPRIWAEVLSGHQPRLKLSRANVQRRIMLGWQGESARSDEEPMPRQGVMMKELAWQFDAE